MGNVRLATHFVIPDELAQNLTEIDLPSPDGMRRYQIITVMRGGQEADHKIDMGPASAFTKGPIRAVGLWVHTVAELQEQANWLREVVVPDVKPSDSVNGYLEQLELKQRLLKGGLYRQFGYGS